MKVNKLSERKKTIGQLINDTSSKDFPKSITFNRGIEYPKYKITIEEIEDDFFIDAKGNKWIRSKEDAQE